MKKLIFYLVISTLLSFSLSEICNPQDKKALLQIKKNFGNAFPNWKSGTDCCSQWYGVECDSTTHRIISIEIFASDISGQIPLAIGDLLYLQKLDFHKLSNVTGTIQPAIAKLKSLTFLRLNWLNLTGSVPEFLSQLKNLTFLDLAFNSLSGSIPSSLASLPNLDAIHLDRNKLTGTIPASFGAFQGDASMLFGPNETTETIDVSRNLLEFDLSKVIFPADLGLLDINHNKIYGSLPDEMTKLSLQLLNVSYNRLCGRIPVGGKLQNFDYSTYFHNRCLCGTPLPNCK